MAEQMIGLRSTTSQHRHEEQLNQQRQQQTQPFTSDMATNSDRMEYIIKFPQSSLHYTQAEYSATESNPDNHLDLTSGHVDIVQDDRIHVSKDINLPIVMLLGWAGCQDKYLMKYSKIYEDRGLITIRYTAPVDTLFWKRAEMVPIGEKILKLIYDMNFEKHPIIFHIFSNGGAYLYQHISIAMRKHRTPLLTCGMIIDSAPGERRILGLYRAVTAIYGRNRRKCSRLTAIVITLTLGIMWLAEETFCAFKSLFVKTQPIHANPFNGLKNEPNEFPQLFLYSKGDIIIPYTDIEKFIKCRQQQGVEVKSVCFEDAEHVKIFTKYPQQYIQCVCNFINNCLLDAYNLKMTAVHPVSSSLTSLPEIPSPSNKSSPYQYQTNKFD